MVFTCPNPTTRASAHGGAKSWALPRRMYFWEPSRYSAGERPAHDARGDGFGRQANATGQTRADRRGPPERRISVGGGRSGLARFVRFAGWRPDATQLLPALDIFVLSSLSEGISLALLDAMAAGVPAVATAVGGNREVIEESRSGILVPVQAPVVLAQALLALIHNPARRRELGAGGRRRVEEAFSFRRMIDDYEALYASALN